jgi:hypothetical protein
MDPGRLAVFASPYAQQRAVISRHVEDLLFVERFLVQRGFALALEEQLVTGLSWTPAQLQPMAAIASLVEDGVARLREVEGALATKNTAALAAALTAGDDEMQRAVAETLAAMRQLEPLAPWFRAASPAAQRDVISALQHDKQGRAGPLTEDLLRAMASAPSRSGDSLRDSCGIVLARGATLDTALRVAALSHGAMYVVQALVAESADLKPHETAQVLDLLAERGWLKASAYGIDAASKRGAIPDSFVPSIFARASPETRLELCRIAEQQLDARHDPKLHAFLLQTVFGPFDAEVRAAAWWSLSCAGRPRPGRPGGAPVRSGAQQRGAHRHPAHRALAGAETTERDLPPLAPLGDGAPWSGPECLTFAWPGSRRGPRMP